MTMLGTDPREALLNTLQARFRYVSLHTGEARNGAHELRGDYYRRQPVSWLNGRNEQEIRFTVPEARIVYIGYWDQPSGGMFQGAGPTEAIVTDEADYYVIPAGRLRLRVEA